MEIKSALHNHCTLCDGADSLDDMIAAAVSAGFTDFGMSCHGVTPFDIECSLKDEAGYITAVNDAKSRWAGKINVHLGIEQDYYAPVADRGAFEYLIGSVHYIYGNGVYYSVDNTPEMLRECIDEMFAGNALAMVQRYYDLVCDNAAKFRPDIIGHFDLVTKFNEHGEFFDENSREYLNIAISALEKCAAISNVFEVNTGAISRKWRTQPYPCRALLKRLRELGCEVTLSADSHSAKTVAFGLTEAAELCKSVGFDHVLEWHGNGFEKVNI